MEHLLIIVNGGKEHILIKSDISEKFDGIKFTNPMDFINHLNAKYGIGNYELKNV